MSLRKAIAERHAREEMENKIATMARRNEQIHGGAHSAAEQAAAIAGAQTKAQIDTNKEMARVIAAKEAEQAARIAGEKAQQAQAGSSSERKP